LHIHKLSYLVMAAILLAGLLQADQITLKNGDRVTGKIVKKDGDKVTFNSELLGEVTIPWTAVTNISSDEPLVVILPEGKTVSGKITVSDGNRYRYGNVSPYRCIGYAERRSGESLPAACASGLARTMGRLL
jgi:ribosomal protein S1